MKRFFFLFVFIILAASLGAEPLNISVGIPPQKFITEAVGGSLVSVNVLMPSGSDPHTFSPKTSQIARLSKSRIFFGIGFPFEEAVVKRVAKSSSFSYVNTAGMYHAHEEDDEHGDPHVWTSPRYMLFIAQNTLDSLISADSKNKDAYMANFEKLQTDIKSWDNKFKKLFDGDINHKFLVYHPFLGSFADDYGLIQYAVEIDGKPPKAQDLKKIMEKVKSENIKVFITHKAISPDTARIVAKSTGLPLIVIDNLAEDWNKMMQEIYDAFNEK